MKKVYTRTGDKGTTGIHGGARVPKDDIRIEANGCLDELNAVIGIVRSMLPTEDNWQELLHTIQRELMVVMSHVATPDGVLNPNLSSAGWYACFCATAFCPHSSKACRATLMDTASPSSAE